MSNHYLHALPSLAFVPRLPQLWLHVTRQDGDADALALQDTFQAPRHVAGASVNREHISYVEYGLVFPPDFLLKPVALVLQFVLHPGCGRIETGPLRVGRAL